MSTQLNQQMIHSSLCHPSFYFDFFFQWAISSLGVWMSLLLPEVEVQLLEYWGTPHHMYSSTAESPKKKTPMRDRSPSWARTTPFFFYHHLFEFCIGRNNRISIPLNFSFGNISEYRLRGARLKSLPPFLFQIMILSVGRHLSRHQCERWTIFTHAQ